MKQLCDKEGRCIIIDLDVGEHTLTICNIYAPNKDYRSLFEAVFKKLLSFRCDEISFGGDFNLFLDILKDKMGGTPSAHSNSLKVLKSFLDNLDLMDIWRDLNPEGKRFTWRQNKPKVHCCLDFFLVSASIAGRVSKADILPSYKTDHSLCTIEVNYQSNKRGPGFWKLNSALFSEIEYINTIKATIAQTLTQYENDVEVDEVLLSEMIKLEIRATSIKYSKTKMKGMRKIEDTIESEITSLERRLESDSGNNKVALAEQLKIKKKELESVIECKTKGAIIRSKTRWYNEGEKNSKYFLNLENRHCTRKTIVQIKGNNGSYLTKASDILEGCNSFYGSVYTSRNSTTVNKELENLFLDQDLPKLNDDNKQKCERLLTAKGCLEAVKLMKSGKSPGTDGLLAEFYMVFWNDISPHLVSSLKRSYQKGKLAITQRRGFISLIPKKDKALDELKHLETLYFTKLSL